MQSVAVGRKCPSCGTAWFSGAEGDTWTCGLCGDTIPIGLSESAEELSRKEGEGCGIRGVRQDVGEEG